MFSLCLYFSYGTTSVWCRDGNRNVAGCCGLPYLKLERFRRFSKFPFHVCWSIWNSYSRFWRCFCSDLYHFPVPAFGTSRFQDFGISQLQTFQSLESTTLEIQKFGTPTLKRFPIFRSSDMKNNIVQACFHFFLSFFAHSGNKSEVYGSIFDQQIRSFKNI